MFKASVIVSSACLSRLNQTEVVVGEHRYDEANPSRRYYVISQFLTHKDYRKNDTGRAYDLALLRLFTDISMSDNVMPICAPNPDNLYAHRQSIFAGWGSMEGKLPNHIRNVSL